MSASSHLTEVAQNGLAWQLLQTMQEAAFLVDRKSLAVLASNHAAEELTGLTNDEAVRKSLSEIFATANDDDFLTCFGIQSSAETAPKSLPVYLGTDHSRRQPLTANAQRLDADGQALALVTVRRPNSANKEEHQGRSLQTEQRIHRFFDESPIAQFEMDWSEIQARLQQIVDSGVTDLEAWLDESPDEIAKLGGLAKITTVNRGALDMFEAKGLEEFAGNLGTILRQDSLRAFKKHLLFRVNGGRTFEAENVAYTISGKRVHVSIRATTAADAEQSWNRIYASVSDITQQRNAEKLRDSQRKVLESLAEINSVETVLQVLAQELEQQSPDIRAAVFSVSSSGNKLRQIANGTTAEEIVTLLDAISVDDLFGVSQSYSEIRLRQPSHQENSASEVRGLPSTAELISRAIATCGYQCGVLKPAASAHGILLGVLAVFRPTSDEFTAHEEEVITSFSNLTGLVLQHEQHRRALTVRTDELQSIFDNYPDALLRLSSDGTILESYSGNELTEFLQLSETPTGQLLWNLFPHPAAAHVRTAIEKLEQGARQETVHFTVERNQSNRDFELRLVPLPSTDEQIAVLRDVQGSRFAAVGIVSDSCWFVMS